MSEKQQQNSPLSAMSLVGSIFKFSIATWVNAILYLVTLFVVSYAFRDKAGFGEFDMFYTASMTVMNVALLGLDHAYIRFYHKPPKGCADSQGLAAMTMLFSIGSLAVFTLVLSLAFPEFVSRMFFDDTQHNYLAVFICINAFFLLTTRFFNITYRMQQNVKMYTVQSILLQFFSRMFYVVGIFFLTRDLNSLIIFNLVGLGFFALVFFLLQRRTMLPEKLRFSPSAYKPLLKYGVALAPSPVFQWANTLFSRVYINVMMGGTELSVFSFVNQISLALGIIQSGFSTFWSAFIFGNYKTEQKKIIRIHDYLTFIILLLMAALILFQRVIFGIFGFFGEWVLSGEAIFGLMLFAPMLSIVSETTVYGTAIAKKTIYDSIGIGINVLVNVLLCLWLIPNIGMVGAAVALAVAGGAQFVFRTLISQKYYKSAENLTKTFFSIGLMAVLCIVSYVFVAQPLVVAFAAGALAVFYCIFYKTEFRRCLKLGGEVFRSVFRKKAAS